MNDDTEKLTIRARATLTPAADAEVVITDSFTSASFDWFAIEALRERVTLTTLDDTPTPRHVRDMAIGVFSILSHTPITALGMNHTGHLWLRPPGWQKLITAIAGHPTPLMGEAETFTRVELSEPRKDDLDGTERLTLEPSSRIPDGVWLSFNSHVNIPEAPGRPGAEAAVEVAAID